MPLGVGAITLGSEGKTANSVTTVDISLIEADIRRIEPISVGRAADIPLTPGEPAIILWLLIRGAKDQPLEAAA
jgi:hypothetical protein